ncbi:MAG: hypothetical protein ABI551_26930, partial [Polyangiaceae bacterium]
MSTDELEIKGLDDDAEGRMVVAEELKLLRTVKGALASAKKTTARAAEGRTLDEHRLLDLRDQAATAKPEDLPALLDQMHQIGALYAQRGKDAVGFLDVASPYFGHLRL